MTPTGQPHTKSWLDRLLSLAADVRPGEAATAALLSLNGFLILAAYYVIRPVRNSLLTPIEVTLFGQTIPGNELTSYSGAVLALLFVFIVPAYGAFASRVNRVRLINGMTLFFVANLLIFYALGIGRTPGPVYAITFYLWASIFNLMVIAQFWSFANDLYTPEEGKRLFAIVGFGGTLGAIAGSYITRTYIVSLGDISMFLISAAMLVACLVLTNIVNAREGRKAVDRQRAVQAGQPLSREGGFQLVIRHRYLLLIGLVTLVIQVVNTNGNFIFDTTLREMAESAVAAGTAGGLSVRDLVGSYNAGRDFYQNVLGAILQFFAVSRILKYMGVSQALFIMPLLALVNYSIFALFPVLALIRVAKITENAADYSLQNTLRRALFLPTSREAKYKALNAVETFFWRAGDMLSGVTTLIVVRTLGLGVREYAIVNIALVIAWLVIAAMLGKENRKLSTAPAMAA
jgi:ATP:ADP antiporter, AAA family